MIRFKCIYCGHRILARDDGADKKCKCPNCQHILVVPKTTKGRPAVSSDKEPIPERPKGRIPEWEKDLHFKRDEQEELLTEVLKESFGFLVPTYDPLSLLLMAVTLILLLVTNPEMSDYIQALIENSITIPHYRLIFFYLALIFAISLFSQLLTFDKETDFKKKLMLGFAVLTNVAVGIIAGMYMIRNTTEVTWLLVFPAWNIINSLLMVLMLRFRIIDEDCISDREATFVQIILGLIAVVIIVVLCNYVFKLYWAVTSSICIVYTTSFDRALQNVFPGLTHREDE